MSDQVTPNRRKGAVCVFQFARLARGRDGVALRVNETNAINAANGRGYSSARCYDTRPPRHKIPSGLELERGEVRNRGVLRHSGCYGTRQLKQGENRCQLSFPLKLTHRFLYRGQYQGTWLEEGTHAGPL
jgi:hypothetical protein